MENSSRNTKRITRGKKNEADKKRSRLRRATCYMLHVDGFSTLELLIAFSILTLSLTAVVMVAFGNQSISIDTQTNNEALYKAQGGLERARAASRLDFGSVVSQSSIEPSGLLSYTKALTVTNIDDFTKQAVSTVTWQAEGGRTLYVTLSTLLTDPVGFSGGDTCNPTLAGDWTAPQKLGSADVGQNNGGTDIDIVARKAYVTANAASADKGDFYIVDVSDPYLANLPIVNNPPDGLNTGPGLAAVHVAGKYAYVANESAIAQLQVIDISAPTAPVVVAGLDVTSAGDTAVGNSIFYANKKIYLGLTKSNGPEFYIIDVSDPLSPTAIPNATFETDTRVNAIMVKNDIAYVATPWPTSNPPTQENLSLLDVSNPSAGIPRINTFTYADPSTLSGESLYMSKDGDTLYLGRGGLNGANNPEFFSLNISDPYAAPLPILNSKYIPTSNDVAVRAIMVRENLAFMWTSDTNLGFQIWDLNNLGSPMPYASLNTEQTATGGFDCDGNLLYTAQRSNKALQIIGPGQFMPTVALSIHDVSHNVISTANDGDIVHAKIAVAGGGTTPTGNVDVTFYTDTICSAGASADPANPLVLDGSGVVDPSSAQGPLATGFYSFKAHYNGDANYDAGDSACQSLEILAIPKVDPVISTTIYDASNDQPVTSVVGGTAVYDTVTITGGAGTPTGSVDFTLYRNKDDCSGGPTTSYNGIVLVSGVAQTPSYTTTNKSISYMVHYNGDTNYNAMDGICEPLTVN